MIEVLFVMFGVYAAMAMLMKDFSYEARVMVAVWRLCSGGMLCFIFMIGMAIPWLMTAFPGNPMVSGELMDAFIQIFMISMAFSMAFMLMVMFIIEGRIKDYFKGPDKVRKDDFTRPGIKD